MNVLRHLWRLPLGEYDGRLMRCAPGTHEAAADLMLRHVPREAAVLDLASGTGAFLARLQASGYHRLSAVELNVEGFRVDGVTPQPVDLNSDFHDELPAGYGLITAIEIIEHLDCPRRFVRSAHALLADGGFLLLSTPNVAHWLGRLRFAISGELRPFRRGDYDYQRHISPITGIQMRLMLEELGFTLVEVTTAGTFFGLLKQAVFSPVTVLSRLVLGPAATGDVAIYLATKRESGSSSPGRDSFYFRTTGA